MLDDDDDDDDTATQGERRGGGRVFCFKSFILSLPLILFLSTSVPLYISPASIL